MIFDGFPTLENDAVLLRRLRPEDACRLAEMMGDEEVYRYLPTFLPELESESSEAFITRDCDRLLKEGTAILLGIYEKAAPEVFAGLAEFYGYVPERSKISVGYRLRKDCWHRHIATNVVALMKAYALEELGLERITAHVITANQASVQALLKNGFVQRRSAHEEDWGQGHPVTVNKYVIYPPEDPSV